MYWTDVVTSSVQRANLDGTSVETIWTSALSEPADVTVDVNAGKIYFTDYFSDKVRRANLDGTSVEDVITSG